MRISSSSSSSVLLSTRGRARSFFFFSQRTSSSSSSPSLVRAAASSSPTAEERVETGDNMDRKPLLKLEELRCARERKKKRVGAALRAFLTPPPPTADPNPPTPFFHPTPFPKKPNRFDNLVLRALPVEDGPRTTPRPVPGACFSRAELQPLSNPAVVAVSDDALEALLGLDPSEAEQRPREFAEYFGGCRPLPGSEPAAHCYCGHQFGSFAGQLGVSE